MKLIIYNFFFSLKDKINRPPSNPDDQPISKSLQKIINLKNNTSNISLKVKKSRKSNKSLVTSDPKPRPKKLKPVKRLNPEKAPANFTQLPGESSKAFMCRVNQTVKEYLKETKFENKFGVNIKRDETTGEVLGVEKRPKDEFEELLKKARSKKGKKKKKKASKDDEPKLTKSQKKLKKITEKKERRELARADDFDKYKDEIKFGEIVHAPPTLDVPRRVSKTNVASRVSFILSGTPKSNNKKEDSKRPRQYKTPIILKIL